MNASSVDSEGGVATDVLLRSNLRNVARVIGADLRLAKTRKLLHVASDQQHCCLQ